MSVERHLANSSCSNKVNLLNYSIEDLKRFFLEIDEKPFRATQIIKWIHQQGVSDITQMSNLSKVLRTKLMDIAEVRVPKIVTRQDSLDGTRKWLLRLADGNCIETVFIPEGKRGTLCVSSQVGCALDCTFCSTARQGFNRNLTLSEIIGQLWIAKHYLQPDPNSDRVISNVVMMGMGEPLLNFDNVLASLQLMLDDNAYGLSKRRVTVSTSGVLPAIDRLAENIDVALAVSLHAPTNELRDQLVPINKKYPIEQLIETCQRFLHYKPTRETITIEYVLLDGINDSNQHAHQLSRLLNKLPVKINLIPFNPFSGTYYRCSGAERINAFRDIVTKYGYVTTTRKTRGDDIDAACGQLAGKVQDKSRREERFIQLDQLVKGKGL